MRHRAIPIGACLGLLLAAAAATGAAAQEPKFGSVRFFYPHCKATLDDSNSSELFRQGQCSGTLLAVHSLSEQLAGTLKFCSPAETQAGELVRVAVEYIDSHPNTMDTLLLDTAIVAFKQKWPCRR